MRIEIVTGAEAKSLLDQDTFLSQWAALHERCPWAKSFQSHAFARAWYGTYTGQFNPVLVLSRGARGALQGLLALATPAASASQLLVAGRQQSEYHAWVCGPEDANTFPLHALRAVRRAYPAAALTFHYLAPGTPLNWLQTPEGRRYCLLKPHRRPLMRFGNGQELLRSLSKSSNKSRLKRLDKMGGLEFRRVIDPKEFESLFDRIVTLYDFRHGAIHGSERFCSIDRQREFHLAMMRVGLLHATVMAVGKRVAAAHFGVSSGKELQLGAIVHDPTLAKHSPGKFQILLLSRMLIENGYEQFDLTPGGDAYKERFTNGADEVHTLAVLPSPGARARARAVWQAKNAGKRLLKRLGLSSVEAGFRLRRLRQPRLAALALLSALKAWTWSSRELRVYVREVVPAPHPRSIRTVRRDALEDLLRYDPADGGESRQAFLARALQRLEAGQHAYTCTDDDGRLRYCAWLDEEPAPDLPDVSLAGFSLPEAAALVHDVRVFGPAADDRIPADVLRAILADVAASPAAKRIVLAARGEDDALHSAASRLGFEHASTLVRINRLGRAGWIGVHQTGDLLPRRPSPADRAAETAAARRGGMEEVEPAGAL